MQPLLQNRQIQEQVIEHQTWIGAQINQFERPGQFF
jgi:hypothetical protein